MKLLKTLVNRTHWTLGGIQVQQTGDQVTVTTGIQRHYTQKHYISNNNKLEPLSKGNLGDLVPDSGHYHHDQSSSRLH